MLFLNLPATVGLIVLAPPDCRGDLRARRVHRRRHRRHGGALQLYAIGLVGYSIVRIISPTFYALRPSRIPVMVSAASVVVNVALNVTLVRVMGYRGLALGTSITAILNASVQLLLLRREIHGIEGARIASSFARVHRRGGGDGRRSRGARTRYCSVPCPATSLRCRITAGRHHRASLATLAAAAQLLRIREFGEARDLILGRLRRMAG